MPNIGPELVTEIAHALDEACEVIARLSRQPVNPMTRDVLSKRIMHCVESGETDPKAWRDFALGGFADRRI